MKCLLVIVFALLSIVTYGQQDNKGKTEVYAGYGVVTAQDIISGLSNMLAGALLPGMVKRIDVKGGGAYFGGIDYYAGNRVAIGLQINYASFDQQYSLSSNDTSSIKAKYFTPLVHAKFIWIGKEFFQVYSAVSGGATFITAKNDEKEKDNKAAGAFQISPVGIRAGNNLAVFVEAGFGFQGLLSGGVSFRF